MSDKLKSTLQGICRNVNTVQIPKAFNTKQPIQERIRMLNVIAESAAIMADYARAEARYLGAGWEGPVSCTPPQTDENAAPTSDSGTPEEVSGAEQPSGE